MATHSQIPNLLALIFLCVTCLSSSSLGYRVGNNPYHHKEILDSKYELEWLIDWPRERIIFNVTAQTLGYVGFGLSKVGSSMAGADIVVGGVSATNNGKPYFFDMHGLQSNQAPAMDPSQDWTLEEARETKSHTHLRFSRNFQSCDIEHDLPINDDGIFLIWAYGESDNLTEFHFGNRGSFLTYLRDPDLVPPEISTGGRFIEGSSRLPAELMKQDVQVWSVKDRFNIPSKRTTYWCNVKKLTLPRKHHIIGFNLHMNQDVSNNLHHLIFMRCRTPPGINASTIFEPFTNSPGDECYMATFSRGTIPIEFCNEIKAGYAIGGSAIFLPETFGIPIGDISNDGSAEYFILQTHYDNPQSSRRQNLVADIQLDIFHTPRLRANDGGFLSVGHDLPGSPSLLLPPGSDNHRIYGHCSSQCTRRNLPSAGIAVTAGILHSHNAGRRLSIQHFRNGRELSPVLNDDNYQFSYQPIRLLQREKRVLPGDQLTMRCFYNTMDRNTTVVAGFGTNQEMCKTFMMYYPLLPEWPVCRSSIVSQDYQNRYLAGATNLTWNDAQLEFVAGAPPELVNMTVSQISDSRFVNWNAELRQSLQRDHENLPQLDFCPTISDALAGRLSPPELVSLPMGVTRWTPSSRCTTTTMNINENRLSPKSSTQQGEQTLEKLVRNIFWGWDSNSNDRRAQFKWSPRG